MSAWYLVQDSDEYSDFERYPSEERVDRVTYVKFDRTWYAVCRITDEDGYDVASYESPLVETYEAAVALAEKWEAEA